MTIKDKVRAFFEFFEDPETVDGLLAIFALVCIGLVFALIPVMIGMAFYEGHYVLAVLLTLYCIGSALWYWSK